MFICFVCNAETEASKDGLIQGVSNGAKNVATKEGLARVRKTATDLVDVLDLAKPENVYLYSGDQIRCLQTSLALADVLKSNNLLLDRNMFIDSRLNGRDYGKFEGMKESEIKTLKYAVKHPKQYISYALAQAGFNKASSIEPLDDYAGKVFSIINALFKEHEWSDNNVVIVSSTPDVFKVMRSHRYLSNLCYCGSNPNMHSIYLQDEVKPGDSRFVEVNQVKGITSDCSLLFDSDLQETRRFPKGMSLDALTKLGHALGDE